MMKGSFDFDVAIKVFYGTEVIGEFPVRAEISTIRDDDVEHFWRISEVKFRNIQDDWCIPSGEAYDHLVRMVLTDNKADIKRAVKSYWDERVNGDA